MFILQEVANLIQNGLLQAEPSNTLGDCGPGPAFAYGFFDTFYFIGNWTVFPCFCCSKNSKLTLDLNEGFNVLRALVLGVQIENVLNYRIAEKGIIRGKHLRSFQSLWG